MRVIGINSGTSVDAIDVAIVDIELEARTIKLLCKCSFEFEPLLKTLWLSLCHERVDAQTLCRANFNVAYAFADAVNETLKRHAMHRSEIAAIGSHGQTIWHEVVAQKTHSTLQIGDGSVIACRTGIPTVSNFRPADVAAGGSGAPLVPIFDSWFLRPKQRGTTRALQNIGGFANVSILSSDESEKAFGFDQGCARVQCERRNCILNRPGNVLIDECMRTLYRVEMDRDGTVARSGCVCEWYELRFGIFVRDCIGCWTNC
jgi:anhydro-N-acetylmuramic acid kinase